MNRFRFPENLLKLSLVLVIFLLLGIASEHYSQFKIYSECQKQIIHSHKLQASLQKLLNAIIDTESLYRATLISDDKEINNYYTDNKLKITSQIDELKHLSADNLDTQSQIDSIQYLINKRINSLDQYFKLMKTGSNHQDKNNLESSLALIDEVESLVNKIVIQETLSLKEIVNLRDRKQKTNHLLLFITVLFSLVIFIISFLILRYYFSSTRRTLKKLHINKKIYEQAEQISHSGHWHYQPDNNKLVFSSNLFNLLGFEPNSFNPSLKKYIKLIRPNDRPIFLSALKKLKSEGYTPPFDLTIITAQGKEKYLRFVAQLITDEDGNDLVVGANKDLTYEIETNKKLNQLNLDLKLQNSIFKYAESIAMIGSYSYDFEKKSIEFSDNLYKILGYEPGSFSPSEKKFVEWEEFWAKISMDKEVTDSSLNRVRIVDPKGKLKHLSVNKKIFYSENKKIQIVTFKDITEEVLINKQLEEKNEELSKTNEELESFNHIASHDLQEPLRKIHTFISRIEGNDDLKGSPLTMNYLARIRIAANRMQKLVIDLLSFSRASKDSYNFESSNLNEILKNALDDLHLEIQKKNAVINYNELLTVAVIPFQFHQLFVNIIANALKYANHKKRPVINIKKEKITCNDLLSFPEYNENELLKITFEDNGIGFEQQYAENIFILFQRLHDKEKYTGTGIGLAICKKIMQNHKGIIYAEGKPGIGSKFTVILPISHNNPS